MKKCICQQKCIHTNQEIKTVFKPIFAKSRFTHAVRKLTIYCTKQHKYINQYLTKCPHYANKTLEDYQKFHTEQQ